MIVINFVKDFLCVLMVVLKHSLVKKLTNDFRSANFSCHMTTCAFGKCMSDLFIGLRYVLRSSVLLMVEKRKKDTKSLNKTKGAVPIKGNNFLPHASLGFNFCCTKTIFGRTDLHGKIDRSPGSSRKKELFKRSIQIKKTSAMLPRLCAADLFHG